MGLIKLSCSFTMLLLIWVNVDAQPCGPIVRIMDRQVVTKNGDVLLVNSWLGGELMMVGDPKGITFNYTLLSSAGIVKKDSTIYLDWPDYYYDFMNCHASYSDWSSKDELYYSENVSTKEYDCMNYQFYSSQNQTILGCFLTGDRKYAYDIAFDEQGGVEWQITNLDSLEGNVSVISNDSLKGVVWEHFLKKKYVLLTPINTPSFTKNTAGNFVFKGFSLERIQHTEVQMRYDSYKQDRCQVKGKGWQIPLEGYLIHMYNPPLVSVHENSLFITVFNDDIISCPGYGDDVYPILYCIDLTTGKISWQYNFNAQ